MTLSLKLVDALPITVLYSQATSSTKKHLGAFRCWKAWASQVALPVFPARGHHVTLYLQHLAESLELRLVVKQHFIALRQLISLALPNMQLSHGGIYLGVTWTKMHKLTEAEEPCICQQA